MKRRSSTYVLIMTKLLEYSEEPGQRNTIDENIIIIKGLMNVVEVKELRGVL